MLYAVISDIHSNLEALEAVLNHLQNQNVHKIACLGDLVGYGANPNECCELLLEMDPLLILGNHDKAAIDLSESQYFNSYAREAAQWTFQVLDEKYKEMFSSLENQLIVQNHFLMVHGAISGSNEYITNKFQADNNIELLKSHYPTLNTCFFGHSHIRQIWGNIEGSPLSKANFQLNPGDHYLINPGSVGQPRNGVPKASYLIYDTEKHEITYHYLEYNIEKAREKILSAGLPTYLADRLNRGA